MTEREEKKAECDRMEKERAPYRAILKQAILNEVRNVNEQKRPLRIYYELISNDGGRYRLGYDDTTDLYQFNLAGFSNMMVSMPLLEFGKLAYQLKLSYLDEQDSPEPAFQDKTDLLKELKTEKTCEVVDIINNEALIYLPGNETHDGYFIRKSDGMSISEEELADNSTFLIAPFIPDYLLNGVAEPDNLLEDEEAFIRGYQAALFQFDSFIYEQRKKIKKPVSWLKQ